MRSNGSSHETWYEDKQDSYIIYEEIPSDYYLIQYGELVGVRRIAGTIESNVWGTTRKLSLVNMFFDGRNNVTELSFKSSSRSDEFSSGKNEVRHFVKANKD